MLDQAGMVLGPRAQSQHTGLGKGLAPGWYTDQPYAIHLAREAKRLSTTSLTQMKTQSAFTKVRHEVTYLRLVNIHQEYYTVYK